MDRPKLEVADIFRRYGEAYRQQHRRSSKTRHDPAHATPHRPRPELEAFESTESSCRTEAEPFPATRLSGILPLCSTAELSQRGPPSSIEQLPAACSLFRSSDSSNKTHSTRTLQRFSPIHF